MHVFLVYIYYGSQAWMTYHLYFKLSIKVNLDMVWIRSQRLRSISLFVFILTCAQ